MKAWNVALVLALSGCPKGVAPVSGLDTGALDVNAPCDPTGAAPALRPFLGAWQPEDSSAIFRACMSGGQLRVDGWDSADGERFVISAVAFDGTELRFDSLRPSTEFRVQNTLAFVDGELIVVRNGQGEGARMEKKGAD